MLDRFIRGKKSRYKEPYYTKKSNWYLVLSIFRYTFIKKLLIPFVRSITSQPGICSHSHGTRCNKPFLHKLFYPLFCRYGTHRLACGAEAGKWLYRGKAFKTIRNGIDVEKYGFCEEKRKSFRKKLKRNPS